MPSALEDLSDCIREDGNDGDHDGTITENDADELMELATLLLERIYTEPVKLEIAREKRIARRG